MAAIDDLQTAWEAKIALIEDDLLRAEATFKLSEYISALQAQASMSANEITSYTIAGRTVTRRTPEAGRSLINGLQNELTEYVYGGVTLADANVPTLTNVA